MENQTSIDMDSLKKWAEEQNKLTNTSTSGSWYPTYPRYPCPSCGHCPTCGRGGYFQPYQPYPNITWTATQTSI